MSVKGSDLKVLVVGGRDTGGDGPLTLPVIELDGIFSIPLLSLNWFAGKKNSLTVFKNMPQAAILTYKNDRLNPDVLEYIFYRIPSRGKFKTISLASLLEIVRDKSLRPKLRKQLILTDEQYHSLENKIREFFTVQVEIDEEKDPLVQLKAFRNRVQKSYELYRDNFRVYERNLEDVKQQMYELKRKSGDSLVDDPEFLELDESKFVAEMLYAHVGDRMVRARNLLFTVQDEISTRKRKRNRNN